VCCVFVVLAGCAATTEHAAPEAPLSETGHVEPAGPDAQASGAIYRATGIAAWYGRELHAKQTASGELFDMHGLSAVHRTLPLGSSIRVTNLENSKSIILRVIDRGPLVKNRLLDVSYGAALELGFADHGVARVSIETLEPVPAGGGAYTVQAAMFTEEENAATLKDRLAKKFELVFVVPLETNIVRFFCVRVGSYASERRAEQVAAKLTLEGLEPLVLKKD